MALAGVILTGFGVGGLQKAGLGADPFTCFVTGMANRMHSTYGICFPAITGILLVLVIVLNRRLVGISTLLNLTICSVAAGIMKTFLDKCFVNMGMVGRSILLLLTLVVICFAASLYYTADLGVSAYDAIALTLSGKYRLCSFRVCRVSCDLICCLVGYLFGANLGIGTVVTAFMMGPVIQWFNFHVTEKYILK